MYTNMISSCWLLLLAVALATEVETPEPARVDPDRLARVDPDRLAKHQRRMEWRRAQPRGCKASTTDTAGSWCDIPEDGRLLVKPSFLKRAQQLHQALQARPQRERDVVPASPELIEEVAGSALYLALQTAVSKFQQPHRLDGEQAGKEPSLFKCRKKGSSLTDLSYFCSVADFSYKAEKGEPQDDDGAHEVSQAAAGATAEMQCARLQQWRTQWSADPAEDKASFFGWLETHEAGFGQLTTLRAHLADKASAASMSQKAIDAAHKKATRLSKQLARELHPDKLALKLQAACLQHAHALQEVSDAVFRRAEELTKCIKRPLRCALPLPAGADEPRGFAPRGGPTGTAHTEL
eukprot:g47698.t1